MKLAIAFFLLAAAVIGFIWHSMLRTDPAITAAAVEPAKSAPTARTAAEARSGVFVLPGAKPQASMAPLPQKRESVPDPLSEYLRTRSVKAFIGQYLPRALSGDGSAAYAITLAISDCQLVTYRDPPAWLAKGDPGDAKFAARQRVYFERVARCEGVGDMPGLFERQLARQLSDIAFKSGSPAAIASSLLAASLNGHVDEAAQRARSLFPLEDGNAAIAMYPYVTRQRNGPILGDPPHSVAFSIYEAAWTLAACDMGMDCGASSRLLEIRCISTGSCGTDYRELLRESLSAYQAALADRFREEIVGSFRTGNLEYFGLADEVRPSPKAGKAAR